MSQLQDMKDDRGLTLDRVGVSGLAHDVAYEGRDGPVAALGRFDLAVTLPAPARGVHLSRFATALADADILATPEGLRPLLERLLDDLDAPAAHAEARFTAAVPRTTPVSARTALAPCPVRVTASLDLAGGYRFELAVGVWVMTVCPCSQDATDGIGHSQRTNVEITVRFDGRIRVDELVDLAESCASSPVYPLLTGEDERVALERAVGRPVFVEDLVRSIAERLEADVRVRWFRVEARSLESVSTHDAFALIERTTA